MKILFKALLVIALITGIYFVVGNIYSSNPSVALGVSTISKGIKFLVGCLKNLNGIFPIFDLIIAFTAGLLIEGVILSIKSAKFIINLSSK